MWQDLLEDVRNCASMLLSHRNPHLYECNKFSVIAAISVSDMILVVLEMLQSNREHI